MLEYVNENGESYTEDEINQFAKDNNTSFDDIISKNGLTPKKQKQNVSPGKQKTVAKKDANATAPNMASKSVPTSLVSKKRKSFFDEAIETPSFEESMNTAIKKKKQDIIAKQNISNFLNKPIETDFSELGGPKTSKRSVMLDKVDAASLMKQQAEKKQVEEDQAKIDQKKIDSYSDKLGSEVWLSNDELNSEFGGKAIYNAIAENLQGELGKAELTGFPMKTTNETDINLIGIADQSTKIVPDYEVNPAAKLLVNKLPSLQDKWVITNGQMQMQNDQKSGIDPYTKALENGKLFLSNDEKNLQKTQNLLLNAKKTNNKAEITRLENEVKKQRDELSLGAKLYDEATGQLLNINDKKKVILARNEKAKQIANDTPYETLRQMQTKSYYELVALAKEAHVKRDRIQKSESTIEKIGTFLKENLPGIGINTGFNEDVKNLNSVIKTGYLPKTLNELPGKHPISLAFNKKLQQYITLTKAMELNNDPITTESNNRAIDFIDKTFKAFTNQGVYQANAVTPSNVDKKEAARVFNDMMATAGFEYKDKNKVDKKVEDTWKDVAVGMTADMTPLVAAMFLTKKATGAQITQASNIATKVISNAGNNTKAVNTAARLFTGGLAEAAHMKIADQALKYTTGAPPTDGTFAFSLGVGNVIAEDLIKTMVTNKIPFVTPILTALATKSQLANKTAQVALGAGIGTATMKVAEGATLVKNELLSRGEIDQAQQWDELTDKQHLAGTFWSMMMLGGFAPKGFYDALKSDIKSIPAFNTESINAGKLLGIEHKLPKEAGELANRDAEIDAAEQVALDNLNKKYEGSDDFEAMANEEVKIRKAANVLRGDLEIKNAKLNIEAGHDAPNMQDVFVATNRLKYGESVRPEDAYALSITPASLIKNQLGFSSNDPLYHYIRREQQAAQRYAEQLDAAGIFGDTAERKEMLGNYFKAREINREIDALKENSKIDPSSKILNESRIEELEQNLEDLKTTHKELIESHKIRTDRDFDIDLEAAIDLAEKTGREKPIQYNTTEEFKDAVEKFTGRPMEEGENAFFHNGTMHVNIEGGKDQKLVGTFTHEGTHLILESWMKDKDGNLTPEGIDFIDNWRNKLSPKERKVVDDRINKNYKNKVEIDEEGNTIISEKDKKEYYEEYLTAFVEAVREGQLSYKAESFSKLKGPLESILSKLGVKKPKFLPGEAGLKEMYTMLKDIAESAKQGKASETAIQFLKNHGEAPKTDKVSFSKAKVEEVQKKMDRLEDQFEKDEIDYDDYTSRLENLEQEMEKAKAAPEEAPKKEIKKEISDEDEVKEIVKSEKGSVASEKVQKLYEEKGLAAAQDIINLFKPITKRIVDKRRDAPGFDRELLTDEIETGSGGILDLIKSYSAEKGVPLAAYINRQLPLRAIAASRRVLEGDFKKDVTEEKGLMAEETVSEVKEKPKYKNALESNVFEPTVLKTMSDKIVTQLRTLKSRIDEPISLNRTVTPLIAEIRDAIGKQLDIDVKKAMGGKKDNELVNWLLKNKRYVLENMTTTWLMGANGQGGIPQAIQKRIDGKWVSYPDWVDQKIDRESVSTDNAGRTSGAELVRRLPNVFNNVSNEAYLGQIVGPDGNPLRGRKESLAKAVSEESAFDIIIKDLEEQGPIYEAFTTNQERLGVAINDALSNEFNKQVDRGNVKFLKANNRNTALFLLQEGGWDRNYPEYVEFRDKLTSGEKRGLTFFLNRYNSLTDIYNEIWNKNAGVRYEKDTYSQIRKDLKDSNKLKNSGFELEESLPDRFNSIKPDLVIIDKNTGTNTVLELKSNPRDYMGSTSNGYFFNKDITFTKDFEGIDNLKAAQEKNKARTEFIADLEKRVKEGDPNVRLTEKGGIQISNKLYNELNREGTNTSNVKVPAKALSDINPGKDILQIKDIGAFSYPGTRTALDGLVPELKGDVFISTEFRTSTAGKGWRNLIERAYFTLDPKFNQKSFIDINKDPKVFFDSIKTNTTKKDLTTNSAVTKSLSSKSGERKGIGVFDFDDTVGLTKSNVLYTMPDDLVLYHGAPEGKNINELSTKGVRFFATDAREAEEYARMHSGKVQEVVIPKSQIADESIAINKIKELGLTPKNKDFDVDEVQFHELIDTRFEESLSEPDIKKLFNSLKNDGIKALSYEDGAQVSGRSTTSIAVIDPSVIGTRKKLTGAEFAKFGSKLSEEGATFDFSEFSKVMEGKPGPMVEKLKKMLGKFGNKDMFILTARPADAAGPIKEFLDSLGIDIPLENITGLGNSSPQAKADWMVEKANDGYNDFYFADDHLGNVDAVKNALDVLDVKSKIQQARAQFSKNLSKDFNQIIEDVKGTENYKVFSDVVARRRGANKNKLDLYVSPSAADFELLLYNFMGKGAKGEEHQKFFNDALIKPYINGNDLMDAARQSIKREYKKLNTQFPKVQKELEKLTPDGDFTYDQAIRVSIWADNGVEIPGLSQRDQKKLTDLVNNDPELSAFKQGLIITGRQGKGWVTPGEHWDASTIISDLHNLTEGAGRKKFLGEFIDNVESIFGKWDNGKLVGPNMNKIEAVYGSNVREALEDSIYRMTNGKNRSFGNDKESSMWSNWVNGSTGTIMFLNTRSAALQLLGAVNFLNFRDNNPYAAAKAFANQKQYWEDFARIWNSDKMKERRGGLKEDVAAAEIANAAAGSKNKVNAVVSYLLKIGYTPTQLADSFAIASGGAPFYRNRIKSYLKEGLTEAEAEHNAWNDFTKVSDETQQSGDPKDISKQQASGAGRLLLTFQNTAMQQSRIVKKAFLDLKNRRGDDKTNISKIVYYLTIQNLMFSALQQGLFAVAFGNDDEEDDKEKEKAKKEKTKNEKLLSVADGVLDSILRGTGFIGGITATLKNMVTKYIEESDKKQSDYSKVVFEAANISPPIGSKLKKLYTGLNQTKYDKDLIKERGWGIMQDGRVHLGPMYSVGGKVVEATTNLPMDRLNNKIENVSQALNAQNKAWQRIMIGMGWSPYSVGIESTPGDLKIKAEGKARRKEEGKIKAEESRERKRDSIRNLPLGEQMKLKLKARKKREANRMKKRKMG